MQIYYYNSAGIYTHSSQLDDTDRDPLQPAKFLIPAGCTTTPPPTLNANEAAVWDGNAWRIEPDFRGATYWLADVEYVMTALGKLPAAASLEKPESVLIAEQTERLKVERVVRLATATVEVDGLLFDADETAINRMTAAILAADQAKQTETPWRLADNRTVSVTLDQLKLAQLAGLQALSAIVLGNT